MNSYLIKNAFNLYVYYNNRLLIINTVSSFNIEFLEHLESQFKCNKYLIPTVRVEYRIDQSNAWKRVRDATWSVRSCQTDTFVLGRELEHEQLHL